MLYRNINNEVACTKFGLLVDKVSCKHCTDRNIGGYGQCIQTVQRANWN